MIVHNGGPGVSVSEAVLFPFDDHSTPFRYRLQCGLVPAASPYEGHTRVMGKGQPGTPDSENIKYYGSVVRVEDEFRMWYIGVDEMPPDKALDGATLQGTGPGAGSGRVCYAVSQDGVHWERPALGLVEYGGTLQNNLVDLDRVGLTICLVLHDPGEADPARRYKMIYEINPFDIGAAFSPDGLRWVDSPHNPVLKHNALEPGGLARFNGCYYLNGQGADHHLRLQKRTLITYVSYDFDHWVEAAALGFRRDVPPRDQVLGVHRGEQAHEGANLWNRGNVVLGLYDQWHGASTDALGTISDGYITIDLGFVVSNDAIHFREPLPDYKMIPSDGIWTASASQPLQVAPSLTKGQGWVNYRDETLTWYARFWGGVVCVARWPRDRLGYFEVLPRLKPNVKVPTTQTKLAPHFTSCAIQLDQPDTRVYLNADGLSEHSLLKVEIVDEQFKPLPGYSGDDCLPLAESGLRKPIAWRDRRSLEKWDHPIRVSVTWEGPRPEDAYVYAVYLVEGESAVKVKTQFE